MAAQLSCVSPDEYVVELGPGTGVVTAAICKVIDQNKLIIIERDHRFAEKIRHDFPKATLLLGDAMHLKELLEKSGITQKIAAVVSSLPLLAMPEEQRHDIVNSAFEVIKKDGAFVQYTYGLLSPLSEQHQRQIGIKGSIKKRVWRNFPPAIIWCYTAEKRV